MRNTRAWLLAAAILLVRAALAQDPSPGADARLLTTTLLPVKESGLSTDGGDAGFLWVQNSPPRDAYLQFDLADLPPGVPAADLTRCTLRLVARTVTYQPRDRAAASGASLVILKASKANADFTPIPGAGAVAGLTTLSAPGGDNTRRNDVALGTGEDLRQAVLEKYGGDKRLTLRLSSDSHKASTLLYSTARSTDAASNAPRLVCDYRLPAPGVLESASWRQLQQNPEHTGRSPWRPFRAPTGFTLQALPLQRVGQLVPAVADYPVIHEGRLYAIGHVAGRNHLYCLDFDGTLRWRQDLGAGKVERPPVISRSGILYVALTGQLAAFDLNEQGKALPPLALKGKPAAFTDLTVGNDGSLFMVLDDQGLRSVVGFTARLRPFLKWDLPGGNPRQQVSHVTLSPDGRKVLVQTPAGAVTIDVTNPSTTTTTALTLPGDMPHDYSHAPVAAGDGIVVFADFSGSANEGHLWGTAEGRQIWGAKGTLLPQPVLGGGGRLYYLQDGTLQARRPETSGAPQPLAGDGKLRTTSNLVLDGADNLYFWDNGFLHGFAADGRALFARQPLTSEVKPREGGSVAGPEQFLRLMVGPDGTLWTNNREGDSLFAFVPTHATADLSVQQPDIRTQTVYRATGKLDVGAVTVQQGQLLFQARAGIAVARGFSVQRGATVLMRTGF